MKGTQDCGIITSTTGREHATADVDDDRGHFHTATTGTASTREVDELRRTATAEPQFAAPSNQAPVVEPRRARKRPCPRTAQVKTQKPPHCLDHTTRAGRESTSRSGFTTNEKMREIRPKASLQNPSPLSRWKCVKYVRKPPQTSGSESSFWCHPACPKSPSTRGVRRGSSPSAKSSATRGGAGP